MNDRVCVDLANNVVSLRLARAEKLNAIDAPLIQGLLDAFETIRGMSDVRAVVVSGEGRAFCAGLDTERLRAALAGRDFAHVERSWGAANIYQHLTLLWRALPVPVIAAVHGVAFGGGLQLMLGADIRYVRPDTRLSFMELAWGIVPDMAGFLFMRDLPRRDLAAELTYTGRVFDGEEALAAGFATRLFDDPHAAALATAREIAARNPNAVRAAKRIFSIADAELQERILRAEVMEQTQLTGSPNQLEAVAAKLAGRPAAYRPAEERDGGSSP